MKMVKNSPRGHSALQQLLQEDGWPVGANSTTLYIALCLAADVVRGAPALWRVPRRPEQVLAEAREAEDTPVFFVLTRQLWEKVTAYLVVNRQWLATRTKKQRAYGAEEYRVLETAWRAYVDADGAHARDRQELDRLLALSPATWSSEEAHAWMAQTTAIRMRLDARETGKPVEELLAAYLRDWSHSTGHGADTDAIIAEVGVSTREILACS